MYGTDHLHGPKKPGRLQRRVRLIELRRSEGISLDGVWLAIANDAIRPAIRYLYFDGVGAGAQHGSHIHPIGRLPQDAERLAVHRNFGKIFDFTEIDPKFRTRLDPIGGRLKRFCIASRSTEIPHAVVRAFLPGEDRKSTRLNSSHGYISYAVFCLKKRI